MSCSTCEVRNRPAARATSDPTSTRCADARRHGPDRASSGPSGIEGEADGQFMGRSGSQMYETLTSSSRTTSAGGGASLESRPGQHRRFGTDARPRTCRAIDRSPGGRHDDAPGIVKSGVSWSATRRAVENVLTLLNAKYVGTPLPELLAGAAAATAAVDRRVRPQPVVQPAAEPSLERDRGHPGVHGRAPRSARRGLLHRRRLRRVCLLDSPPGPFTLDERFDEDLDLFQLGADGRVPESDLSHAGRRSRSSTST